jgi:hypothetical protein
MLTHWPNLKDLDDTKFSPEGITRYRGRLLGGKRKTLRKSLSRSCPAKVVTTDIHTLAHRLQGGKRREG